jgi:hypothetical protein
VTTERERSRPASGRPGPLLEGDDTVSHWVVRLTLGMATAAVVLATVGAMLATAGTAATKDPGALVMNLVIVATFPAVAWVVARSQPEHRIVWVFAAVGLGAAATVFTYGYARQGLQTAPGSLPGAVLVGLGIHVGVGRRRHAAGDIRAAAVPRWTAAFAALAAGGGAAVPGWS